VKNECNGSGGCNPTYNPMTTACNKDSNGCTVGDHCNTTGTCVAGPAKVCTPPNTQCYEAAGSCTAPSGDCSFTMKSGACDDGNACTYNDTCSAGTCAGVAGRSCAASAECPIAGTCNGNGGCTPPADRDTKGNCAGKHTGDACSTCNPCLQGQTCNAAGDCVGAPVSDNTSCSTDACPAGMCMTGACTCMSAPPDLQMPDSRDMSIGGGTGGSGGSAGSGGGGGSGGTGDGGGKGGCAFVAGSPATTPGLVLVLALAPLAFSLRRRLRRDRA
jgi:hypothetical protein